MLGSGLRYIHMARTGLGCVNDVAVSRSLVSTTGVVTNRGIRVISGGGNREFRACVVGNRHNSKYVYLGKTTTQGMRINSVIVVVSCTVVSFRRTGSFGPAIIFPSSTVGGVMWQCFYSMVRGPNEHRSSANFVFLSTVVKRWAFVCCPMM